MHRLRHALRRARRVLGRIAVIFGLVLLFLVALVTAALLHLDTPAGRAWLRDTLNDTLAPVFAGSLVIEEIGHVGFTGLHGVRVTVRDPEGVQVIYVDGADFGLPVLARALAVFAGDNRIDVTVDDVEIDYADVSLEASPSGALRIAEAFALRASDASDEPDEPAPAVYVHVLRARVRHGWLHSRMNGYWIDADIDDVDGAVAVTPGTVSVSVAYANVNTRAAPHGADFTGRLEGELLLPDDDMLLDVCVAGMVGGIPVTADASMRGEQLEGAVELGPTSGEEITRLFPFLQPRGTFALSGRVSGTLESPDVQFDGRILDGHDEEDARITGWAHLQPATLQLDAAVHLERVSLATLDRRAPTSRLDADASLWTEGDGIAFQLALSPSTLEKKTLPPARLRGTLEDERLRVSGTVGAPPERADIALDVDLREKRGSAQVRAQRVDLGRWLEGSVRGTARVDADVEVSWARSPPDVAGTLSATVDRLSVAGMSVARGHIEASARSLLSVPRIDVRARAQGVATGRIVVDHLEVRAHGALDALQTRVAANIHGNDVTASGRVRIDDGVSVDALEVHGLGTPMHGSLAFAGKRFEIALRAKKVDLGAVARMAGLEQIDGTVSIDLHAVRDARGTRGTLVATLENGKIAQLEDLDGHLDASLEYRRVEADAWITWNTAGWVDLSLDAALGGEPASLAAWKSATGSLTLNGRAQLRELVTLERIGLLKKGTLPVGSVRGRLLVNASVERDTPRGPPDLEIAVETEDLALEGLSKALGSHAGKRLVAPPSWKLRGVDVHATATLSGETDDAELELRVRDGRGPLVWLDADAKLPYRALWNDAALRRRPIAESLRKAPIVAWFHTDERRWSDLPVMLRTQEMRGKVRVSAYFDGTLAEPRAGVIARTFGLEHPALPLGFPLDVVLLADWKGERADAHLKLFAPKRQLLDGHVKLDANLAAALAGHFEPWRASASASFCDLPLDSLGMLAGRRVEGRASGELTLDDLNLPSAKLEAKLRVRKLRMNRVLYPSGDVDVSMRDGALDAKAILRQADKGYGQVTAKLPIRWKQAIPELASQGDAKIRIEARKLRIAVLQPFLEETFDELDGRVDANARLELGDVPRLSGTVVLEKGRFQLASFGETFYDTRARVRFSRTGTIVLERFVSRSIGGRVEAKGEARFRGLELTRARVTVRVPHDRKIPVVIGGELYGDASGRVDVSARMDGNKLRFDVDVPELRAELAPSRSEPVQPLDRSRRVRIGVKRNGRFEVLPLGPPPKEGRDRAMPILLVVSLGDVQIERERELMVKLTGKMQIELTRRVRVAGKIELLGGRLDVRGRRFQIERGTITFSGRRPDNPEIVAVASWRAPDGTKVIAEFVGPLKTGKVELRSDPPLSKQEILSLIVFGETDHGGPGTAVGHAAGLGGELAAPGLNEAIDDLTGLDLRARIGASRTNDPTTEIEYVITHELSVQFAYLLNVPPPGASPDRNYGTIDWRFRHDWSLETTVGDHGSTSLDVLWHHRY